MQPHRKEDRAAPLDGADGEVFERQRPARRRRRDPLRFAKSGLFIEWWDAKHGRWRLQNYFRDWDSMLRSYRADRHSWQDRRIRIRYPGDGKLDLPPASVEYARRRASPAAAIEPAPVPEKFRTRVDSAMATGGLVRLVYLDRNALKTVRLVRPLRWVATDRFTAFCELRGAERDFCIDRFLDCQAVATGMREGP